MKRIVLILALLTIARIAEAVVIPFQGLHFEPLEQTSASCAFERSDAPTGDHSFAVRRCSGAQTEGFVAHFHWDPAMTTDTGDTLNFKFRVKPNSVGNVCLKVSVGCSAFGTAINSFGDETSVSTNLTSVLGYSDVTGVADVPDNAEALQYCVVRVRRVIGDGGCADSGFTTRVRDGYLN